MSNRHVRELTTLFACLAKDAIHAYPTLETEFCKDLVSLSQAVGHRGIRVYLVDLPAAGKHLDRCLSSGKYVTSGLPLTGRVSGTVVIPKLFRGLYLLVFHGDGTMRDDYDVQAIYFLRQLLAVAKKAMVPCSRDVVEDEVLDFIEVDRRLPEPEKVWSDAVVTEASLREIYHGFGKSPLYAARVNALDTGNRTQLSVVLARLDIVSYLVTSALGRYNPSDWRFKHGPGAISDTVGPSNKYCWKNWSDRLESEYPVADYGFHSLASWADRSYHDESFGSREPHSRMVAVPKSFTKPRLISAEPCENQWCQQNLWHYFLENTRNSWLCDFVHFDDQRHNQELCRLGSLDGSLATLDLSSASDRVSCHFVGQLFRGNPRLLNCLRASRTRFVSQNLTRKAPALIELRKFSTMGNACTFPVESLAFLSITIACVLTQRGLRPTLENVKSLAGEVAVFGDDLIVPEDSRKLLVGALEVLDFKVNLSKSFWTGKFRESCGLDSYAGCDVTPAYWRTLYGDDPESLASVVEQSNNFYQKYMLHTAAYLASTLPGGLAQVAMDSGVFGLKTRTDPVNYRLRSRYNAGLQRVELLVRGLKASQTKVSTADDTALLQYFTEEPFGLSKWQSGYALRPVHFQVKRWVALSDVTCQQRA